MNYRGEPKPEEWRDIDFDSKYAAGFVWQRLEWLMQYDPYVALFTEHTIGRICALFLSDEVLTSGGAIKYTERLDYYDAVLESLYDSPLAKLLSREFKAHLADLAVKAAFSGSPDNGTLR